MHSKKATIRASWWLDDSTFEHCCLANFLPTHKAWKLCTENITSCKINLVINTLPFPPCAFWSGVSWMLAIASIGFNFVALKRSIFCGICVYETRCSSVICSDLFKEMTHLLWHFWRRKKERSEGKEAVPHVFHVFFLAVHACPWTALLQEHQCDLSCTRLAWAVFCQLPRSDTNAWGAFGSLSSRWGYPFSLESPRMSSHCFFRATGGVHRSQSSIWRTFHLVEWGNH